MDCPEILVTRRTAECGNADCKGCGNKDARGQARRWKEDTMSMIEHFLMKSPFGALTLVNTNGVLSGLYMPDHLRGPRTDSLGSRTTSGFDAARSQLSEYFERKRIRWNCQSMWAGCNTGSI